MSVACQCERGDSTRRFSQAFRDAKADFVIEVELLLYESKDLGLAIGSFRQLHKISLDGLIAMARSRCALDQRFKHLPLLTSQLWQSIQGRRECSQKRIELLVGLRLSRQLIAKLHQQGFAIDGAMTGSLIALNRSWFDGSFDDNLGRRNVFLLAPKDSSNERPDCHGLG